MHVLNVTVRLIFYITTKQMQRTTSDFNCCKNDISIVAQSEANSYYKYQCMSAAIILICVLMHIIFMQQSIQCQLKCKNQELCQQHRNIFFYYRIGTVIILIIVSPLIILFINLQLHLSVFSIFSVCTVYCCFDGLNLCLMKSNLS